jgi:hypothetical protein
MGCCAFDDVILEALASYSKRRSLHPFAHVPLEYGKHLAQPDTFFSSDSEKRLATVMCPHNQMHTN